MSIVRVAFEVDARPVPQGSMTASYNKKLGVAHVHHVAGAALAMWRASVREAARGAGANLSPNAISVRIEFGMPRPKHHLMVRDGKLMVRAKYYYARPAVAPDLDKLVRAVLDALTGICYNDDSQVVEIVASKRYALSTSIEVTDEDKGSPQYTFGLVAAEAPNSRA